MAEILKFPIYCGQVFDQLKNSACIADHLVDADSQRGSAAGIARALYGKNGIAADPRNRRLDRRDQGAAACWQVGSQDPVVRSMTCSDPQLPQNRQDGRFRRSCSLGLAEIFQ